MWRGQSESEREKSGAQPRGPHPQHQCLWCRTEWEAQESSESETRAGRGPIVGRTASSRNTSTSQLEGADADTIWEELLTTWDAEASAMRLKPQGLQIFRLGSSKCR